MFSRDNLSYFSFLLEFYFLVTFMAFYNMLFVLYSRWLVIFFPSDDYFLEKDLLVIRLG